MNRTFVVSVEWPDGVVTCTAILASSSEEALAIFKKSLTSSGRKELFKSKITTVSFEKKVL